jgi:hypothetical protein
MAATCTPIVLDKPEDWPIWIDDIGSSVPDEIWSLVDPDLESHDEFRTSASLKQAISNLQQMKRNIYDQMFKHYQVFLKEHAT